MSLNSTSFVEQLESFLYTPHGLGTLAGAVFILTSLLWLLCGCLCCCCIYCKRRKQRSSLGISKADSDLRYISTASFPTATSTTNSVSRHSFRPVQTHTGTGSSGYQSNIDTFNYSISTLNDEAIAHTSLDSILNQ